MGKVSGLWSVKITKSRPSSRWRKCLTAKYMASNSWSKALYFFLDLAMCGKKNKWPPRIIDPLFKGGPDGNGGGVHGEAEYSVRDLMCEHCGGC